jgi:hypothetical protein
LSFRHLIGAGNFSVRYGRFENVDCEREELIETLSELVKCDPEILRDFPIGLPNIKAPTMGGLLFWEDMAAIKGWRMQRNILSRHWRLLDPDDMRCAWGTNEKMMDIFIKAAQAMENCEGEITDEQEESDSSSSNSDTEVDETENAEQDNKT